VTLRPRRSGKTLTPEKAVEIFRSLYKHEGPPISLDEMTASAALMASGEDVIEE
jgi:hypothetical protein